MISFFLTLPVNLWHRLGTKRIFLLDIDKYEDVYFPSRLESQDSLVWLVYIFDTLKEVGTLLIEVIFSLILVVLSQRFYKQKKAAMKLNSSKKIKTTKGSNSELKICFTICILSTIYNMFSLTVYLARDLQIVFLSNVISAIVFQIKSITTLSLFFFINKKFRIIFFRLIGIQK